MQNGSSPLPCALVRQKAVPGPPVTEVTSDGFLFGRKQGGTVEHESAENRHAGELGAKRGQETKSAIGGLFRARDGAKATRPHVQFAA